MGKFTDIRFMCRGGILAAAFCASASVCAGNEKTPQAVLDDAKRPYEIVQAGRTADHNAPALVPFTDPAGWTVETENAVASFVRATEHLLFGDGVSRLVYRATGKGTPLVRVKHPAPVPVKDAFDTVSCWIYGNNFYGKRPKGTPVTSVKAHFTDSAGRPFEIALAKVRHIEWSVFQRKLPEEIAVRVEKGGSFDGFTLSGGTNTEDRHIEFCSFCVFREKLAPLSFAPRAKRGVQVFKNQPQGVNTGSGRLPFPTVGTTVVPVVPGNPDIEFRMPAKSGSWDDLAFRFRKGPWIPLAKGGGVWPAAGAARTKATFRRIGDSVVADIMAPGGEIEEVRFGGIETDEDAELVPVPYYSYKNSGVADRPCVVAVSCGGVPVFVTATVDWTQSGASEPFSAVVGTDRCIRANGGTRYNTKTDGRRNDVFERFVWTVSTDFASSLPAIPNPVSPWKHVTGKCAWRAYGAGDRAKDCEYWRKIRRMGIRHVVVNDHETGWRDGYESFTFRTDPAPKKGGDKGQYDYARHMIDKLGFWYGPYNNFTDLAPVNRYWHADNVLRQSDGSYRESWARCYSPKPLFGVEMCERLAPEIQRKFRFNTAYCDVHTAVTPWSRTDYDWRVPGAGTFSQTFYAYGEIMLIQKRSWNGPVYSEGGTHWMYCGLTDGNYAQDQGYDLVKNPWLVDFDLLRLHPLCCNFGVGAPYMFYGEKNIYGPLWDFTDPFVACTVAFGHSPFLIHRNTAYGYFMLQALAARYTQADASSIRYADASGALLDTSAAVASGAYRRSQIHVRYSDGTRTVVNGSRDGDWMEVRCSGGRLYLPPFGFAGMSKDVCVVNAVKNGRRIAYARGPEYVYLCAREGKWIDTPGGGTDGELTRLKESGGTEEVIASKASEIVLPYAAKEVVGLADVDMAEKGEVVFSVDASGRTRFKPVEGCYSYRVTPPDGWREPSPEEYLAAAFAGVGDRLPESAKKGARSVPMPYHWSAGMVLRGSAEELPVDGEYGAGISWSVMANEGVQKRVLAFHPPYKKAKGYVYARYRIKVPVEGLVFSAKAAKRTWSVPGDGILFKVAVRAKGGDLVTVSELTVKDYKWHDISADLSRWSGASVDLYLIGDPGPAGNTYGDGGGWADLKLGR